jgi:uncharacterized protein (TIGR00255 family)
MVNSMTGFSTVTGNVGDIFWALELKSVNSRGLDMRMRFAEGGEILEPFLKSTLAKIVHRGAVNVNLRVEKRASGASVRVNDDSVNAVIAAIKHVEHLAMQKGQTLAQTTAAEVLKLPGVYEFDGGVLNTETLVTDVKREIPAVVKSFSQSRASEGAAIKSVLEGQIKQVGELTKNAKKAAGERQAFVTEKLRENLALIMSTEHDLEPSRVEQELALLAVKADITEEIDRLIAHVQAARELLKTKGPIGRKFDFLMQEFNREANTLCSKSGSTALTRIGLDLKTVIDQMREQVQNVE